MSNYTADTTLIKINFFLATTGTMTIPYYNFVPSYHEKNSRKKFKRYKKLF